MALTINADAFIPSIWDASVYRTLEDNLIGKKICNVKPTQQIKAAGDTVYFNGLNDPAVSAYTGTISYENLVSSQVALLIDQQSYYAFTVTDIEQAMANVDLKGSQTERAAYQLQRAIDYYLLGASTSPVIAGAGTTLTADTTTDTTTILSDISEFSRVLEEQNVASKWLVIPPWVKEKLILAGVKFQINNGINGKGGMSFANYLDFDIYVSNVLYNSGTAAAPVSTVVAGSYNSIVYADALSASRAMELEDAFNIGVSGLAVYGAKVVKPMELVKRIMTYTAETAI